MVATQRRSCVGFDQRFQPRAFDLYARNQQLVRLESSSLGNGGICRRGSAFGPSGIEAGSISAVSLWLSASPITPVAANKAPAMISQYGNAIKS